MKNAPRPVGNFYDEFNTLVENKKDLSKQKILRGMYGIIDSRYKEYTRRSRKAERIRQVSRKQNRHDALRSCYGSGTRFRRELLASIGGRGAAQLVRCPYCQIVQASTWDHFLPSEHFPDYFVFRPNLVRVCHDCNEFKGDRLVTPIRKTIHPYFDPLTTVQYLRCKISGQNIAIQYFIRPDKKARDYSKYVERVVRRHFDSYDLANKFQRQASALTGDFEYAVKLLGLSGRKRPTAKQCLIAIDLKLSDLIKRGEGINSWQVVFWKALKNYPEMTAYVNNILTT